jgi:TetR/AcrR family transcriptional regulator, transcriptional repressor of bet genes
MKRALRTELTSEARKGELIEGMLRSIQKHGYANTTVQTICEESGVSRGLLSHYFDGKEGLLIEAFRHLTVQTDMDARRILREAGPDPFVRLIMAAVLPFRRPVEHGEVWLHFWSVALTNREARKLRVELWGSFRKSVEHLMVAAARERQIAIDIKLSALIYTQLIDGLWVGSLFEDDIDLDTCQTAIRDWLCLLFQQNPADYPLISPSP